MSQNMSIGSPITPQSAVVVNGQFDRISHAARLTTKSQTAVFVYDGTDDSLFTPCKHELAIMNMDPMTTGTLGRGSPYGVNDPDLRVLTSANALSLSLHSGDVRTEREKKRDMRTKVRFIGVNLTYMPADRALRANNAMSLQIHGMVTIINTGMHQIEIGDRLVWDLPPFSKSTTRDSSGKPYGTPDNKKLIQVVPYKNAYEDMLTETHNKTPVDVRMMHDELRYRVIGQAMGRARPGQSFDMLLSQQA